MDPNKEFHNISQNILDDEDPKYYRYAIREPNAYLWHTAIDAEIDVLHRNYTCDVVDTYTDWQIVDSKWVFKIKCISEGFSYKNRNTISSK
jgi:hypothetical protein